MSKNIYFCPAWPGDEIDFPAWRFKDEFGNFVSWPWIILHTQKTNTIIPVIQKELITTSTSTPKIEDLDACTCSKWRSRCSDDQYCGQLL